MLHEMIRNTVATLFRMVALKNPNLGQNFVILHLERIVHHFLFFLYPLPVFIQRMAIM